MEAEKKKRQRRTFADRIAEADKRVASAKAALEKAEADRRALIVSEQNRVAEAQKALETATVVPF